MCQSGSARDRETATHAGQGDSHAQNTAGGACRSDPLFFFQARRTRVEGGTTRDLFSVNTVVGSPPRAFSRRRARRRPSSLTISSRLLCERRPNSIVSFRERRVRDDKGEDHEADNVIPGPDAMPIHRRPWGGLSTNRPGLRRRPGATRCWSGTASVEEDVLGPTRRATRSCVGRLHDARVREPEGKQARPVRYRHGATGSASARRRRHCLTELGYEYAELRFRTARTGYRRMRAKARSRECFVNGIRIGGLEALERWARKARDREAIPGERPPAAAVQFNRVAAQERPTQP